VNANPSERIVKQAGSNRSVDAPRVAVPASTRSWVIGILVVIAVILIGYRITALTSSASPSSVSAVSAAETHKRVPATEPVFLTMAPGGESEHIPVPPDTHPVMHGDDYVLHVVYRSGRDCTSGCPDGPLLATYAKNLDTRNRNVVSLTFVPKGQ